MYLDNCSITMTNRLTFIMVLASGICLSMGQRYFGQPQYIDHGPGNYHRQLIDHGHASQQYGVIDNHPQRYIHRVHQPQPAKRGLIDQGIGSHRHGVTDYGHASQQRGVIDQIPHIPQPYIHPVHQPQPAKRGLIDQGIGSHQHGVTDHGHVTHQHGVIDHSPQPYTHLAQQPQPAKRGQNYHVIMYEKREFVDPPKGHRGQDDKDDAKRYYSYGYGIGYGQHAPGKEYEKGYGYVRAFGEAKCKQPPCQKKFDFIGNKEPYGIRN